MIEHVMHGHHGCITSWSRHTGVILWLLNHISVQCDVIEYIHEFIYIGAEIRDGFEHSLQIHYSTGLMRGFEWHDFTHMVEQVWQCF